MRRCTLSVNVFSTKVLIGDTIFYVSNWRRDRHVTWSSDPRQGLAACTAEGVPSLLTYFKTLSIGPALGIEPCTLCSGTRNTREIKPITLSAVDYVTPSCILLSSSHLSPLQTDATLLDIACCVHLHTLLHIVACCWELLRKV